MTDIHIAVAEILMDIEKELRELRLWDADMISAEALASEQPFAVDTMTFPQWLQFVFLPRMYFLIEQKMPLPGNCGISPMAEEYFSVLNLPSLPLILHLQKIDVLLTK
ncbi:YqcC family protein [Cellvibrio sp. NN19]|uniref:YqcC family protein n=1 Tax=Cellvibrio chitinivorans TaxID=3102792 RepID=UPI002B40F0B4|nr:YqcC family protein [Cellvibrio sp. NN19]